MGEKGESSRVCGSQDGASTALPDLRWAQVADGHRVGSLPHPRWTALFPRPISLHRKTQHPLPETLHLLINK